MMRWTLAIFLILSQLELTVVGNEPGITCGDYVMVVSFEKNRFPSLNASRLHLLNPSCLATETSTHLYVNTSLNSCGTSFVETGDVLVFSNVIRQDASPQQSSANDGSVLITREHDFKLPFQCSYSRKKLLGLYFVSVGRIDIPGAEGLGNITFKLDVYRSPSYATHYTNDEYPVEVILNDYMYFEYSVESGAQDLVIIAENCRATKGEIFYSTPYSTVIENGCPRDTTLVYDYNGARSYQRFKLRARWFFNDHDTFYMHCELLACHKNSNSRCLQECFDEKKRTRREVEEEISTLNTYIIKRGPLVIKERTKEFIGATNTSAVMYITDIALSIITTGAMVFYLLERI